jgi:nicotinate-nucleotide adenylyltransferase
VYPGSFDPLTTAHLAIADAAVAALGLDELVLVLSSEPLAKSAAGHSPLGARVEAIELAARGRPWLRAVVTDDRLIADIAAGYDACVVGADKWHQLHDVRFYGDSAPARDAALARLPLVAVAPRAGLEVPASRAGIVVLSVAPAFHEVSSTGVRAGRDDWRA